MTLDFMTIPDKEPMTISRCKRFFSTLLAVLLGMASSAVASDTTTIAKSVPAGYTVMDLKNGDLNLDGRPDALVVLEKKGIKDFEEVKRPLLIFTRGKDNTLKLVARNDDVVLCKACGGVFGDPYVGLAIKNGFFTVEHYGGSNWRWTLYITFKFNAKDGRWYLWKQGGDSFHTSDPNKVETKVQSQKDFGLISFEKYHPDRIKP